MSSQHEAQHAARNHRHHRQRQQAIALQVVPQVPLDSGGEHTREAAAEAVLGRPGRPSRREGGGLRVGLLALGRYEQLLHAQSVSRQEVSVRPSGDNLFLNEGLRHRGFVSSEATRDRGQRNLGRLRSLKPWVMFCMFCFGEGVCVGSTHLTVAPPQVYRCLYIRCNLDLDHDLLNPGRS